MSSENFYISFEVILAVIPNSLITASKKPRTNFSTHGDRNIQEFEITIGVHFNSLKWIMLGKAANPMESRGPASPLTIVNDA